MRLPKSPEEKRATKAARQARWRANNAQRKAADAAIAHSMGLTPGETPPPLPDMPKTDLAKLMRDRINRIVASMDDEDLLNKDFAPALNLGLKAEAQIEAREKAKAKQGNAELAWAILEMLGRPRPASSPQLPDGLTIEGAFEEVGLAPE